MNKYKWIRVFPLPSKEDFIKKLISYSFSQESNSGFVVDKSHDDFIVARYIEKIIYTDVIEDPYGNTIEQEIISFKYLFFKVFFKNEVIEIMNPDVRVLKGFYGLISESNNFKVTIEPMFFNPHEWSLALIDKSLSHYYIEQVEFDAIKISESTSIKLIAAGEYSVVDECKKILNIANPPFKRIKLKSKLMKGIFVDIKSSGLVSVSSRLPDEDYFIIKELSCQKS